MLQIVWPGDFGVGLRHGGPALATWVALIGGLLALAAVAVSGRRRVHEHHRLAAAAAALFVLPVVVHGFSHWGPKNPHDPDALSPRLIHNLRTKVPKGAIVIAPVRTSYEVAAVAPVYIVAAPVTHVANTNANDPYRRVADVHRWIQSNDPAIARRYGATWAIRAGRLYRLPR